MILKSLGVVMQNNSRFAFTFSRFTYPFLPHTLQLDCFTHPPPPYHLYYASFSFNSYRSLVDSVIVHF